ncbi:MAG: hypothetical protein IH991_02855, partial [Planctomycetes bacterium]|nr:hypothetical protein [Planctomycetota bacterium]
MPALSDKGPVSKDVLELMLRLFDRNGMRLIASVRFSTALPELEPRRKRGESGIELVNADGDPWPGGLRYNPANPRVQAALRHVVQGIVNRYAHHPSFAGLAIELEEGTHTIFPEMEFGTDTKTFGQFAKDANISLDDEKQSVRRRWLTWRAAKLGELFLDMKEDVVRGKKSAKLYLTTSGLLSHPVVWSSLSMTSRQPDIRGALLQVGINPKLFQNDPSLVLLRPTRISVENDSHIDVYAACERDIDAVFASRFAGVMVFAGPRQDERAPPQAASVRRHFVHALAAADAEEIFDATGFGMLTRGAIPRAAINAFRHLPSSPFRDMEAGTNLKNRQPVVVRYLKQGNRTFVYLLNDSPWPVESRILLHAKGEIQIRRLGQNKVQKIVDKGKQALNVALDAYGYAAFEFQGEQLAVLDWETQLPQTAIAETRLALQALHARVNHRLGKPLEVLTDPNFEASGSRPRGWQISEGAGIHVALDGRQAYQGGQSLFLRSS